MCIYMYMYVCVFIQTKAAATAAVGQKTKEDLRRSSRRAIYRCIHNVRLLQ